jgi:hypothetical protein
LHVQKLRVYRDANGKPRQRAIHLGGITEKNAAEHPLMLYRFWRKVGEG